MHPSPGLQTPDFQKKSGVPGPRIPDSRFPEKTWSTGAPDSRLQISRKNLEYRGPGLQTPDFQKNLEYRGPGLQTPDFQKESGVPGPPDSRLQTPESGVQGPGTPDFFWNLESGVWRYSRFFLEIWSLESGGTTDFFWKSGVWSPAPPKTSLPEAKCVDHGGGGGRA